MLEGNESTAALNSEVSPSKKINWGREGNGRVPKLKMLAALKDILYEIDIGDKQTPYGLAFTLGKVRAIADRIVHDVERNKDISDAGTRKKKSTEA